MLIPLFYIELPLSLLQKLRKQGFNFVAFTSDALGLGLQSMSRDVGCSHQFFRTNTWDEKGIVQEGQLFIEKGSRGRRDQQAGCPVSYEDFKDVIVCLQGCIGVSSLLNSCSR